MNLRYATLLLDLDGTLVDSVPDIADALSKALMTSGLPRITEAQCRNWIGGGVPVLIKRALQDLNASQAMASALQQSFLKHYETVNGRRSRCYPGVESTLKALAKSDIRLAIVTNKPVRFAEPLLVSLHIRQFFDVVTGGDSTPQRKPAAEPVLYTLTKMGATVAGSLMVGDSRADADAARNAGAPFVWVNYGYHRGENAESLRPDYVLDTFTGLQAIVDY